MKLLRAFSNISKTTFFDIPQCNTCKYFSPNVDNIRFSKCKFITLQNNITGDITYEYAINCRINRKLCDFTGVFYSKK
jgi:hypothetical protein